MCTERLALNTGQGSGTYNHKRCSCYSNHDLNRDLCRFRDQHSPGKNGKMSSGLSSGSFSANKGAGVTQGRQQRVQDPLSIEGDFHIINPFPIGRFCITQDL